MKNRASVINQKPRQGATALDVGPDEEETVTRIENALTNDFDYPDNSEVIQITITPTRSQ
ncbi:hypothetical protein [Fodinibius sp.]|uniref:hypothetical protein n=1 Tax=Fodinibius sp. TaxID=1872440 RepID=UPI003A100924